MTDSCTELMMSVSVRNYSRKRILATYDRAISIAQRVETASKNLKEMKIPKSDSTVTKSESVHKVFRKKSQSDGKEVTCHHCGTPGHLATRKAI